MTSHKVEADDVCDGPKHRSSCSTVEEDLAAATSRNAISKAPRAAAIAVAISSNGTDQRSALARQPHQVSEGKLTCQGGSWEVAATAACDPISGISTNNLAVMHKLLCNVVAYGP